VKSAIQIRFVNLHPLEFIANFLFIITNPQICNFRCVFISHAKVFTMCTRNVEFYKNTFDITTHVI